MKILSQFILLAGLLLQLHAATGALREQEGRPGVNDSEFSVNTATNAALAALPAVGTSTAKTSSPFHFAKGPTNAEAAIRIELQRLGFTIEQRGITNIDKLMIMPPLAQFHLAPLGTSFNSNRLGTVTANGYFYRILQGDREAASAEVGVQKSGRIQFSILAQGADETITIALNEVSGLKQIQGDSYEARILLLPRGQPFTTGLRLFEIIWLKSDTGATDLLYPVYQQRRRPRQFQAGRAYTPNEFFSIIYPNRN